MRPIIWLCFLILAISALRVQHHEKETPVKPRIRKSIHALNPTERKSFFWSLKALGVLPPPQGYNYWTHNSLLTEYQSLEDFKKCDVKPKCLHDLLIASHKTNMLHKTFLFLSYHKHWQMLYEIFLTFAHSVLRQGKSKLLSAYPEEFYTKNAALWDKVFEEYKKDGCADVQYAAAHYWNPTNFKDRRDFIVPIEIASPWDFPQKVIDTMDDLFYAVRGHHTWQYNAKTRLVSEQYKWDVDDIRRRLKDANHFSDSEEPFHYNQDELNLISGSLNPRLQPEGQNFDQFNKTYNLFIPDQNKGRMIKKIQQRYRKYFENDGKKENIAIFKITDQQMFVSFGVDTERQINGTKSVLKRSYITKKQRLQLNIPYSSMLYYNRRLPHYTFANALFNRFLVPTFKEYMGLPHGMENSHSKIHNYHGQVNQVIGLNIFIYHGIVDLMIEMRIRAANTQDRMSKHGKFNFQAVKNAYSERHVKQQGFMQLDEYQMLNTDQKAQYQKVIYKDLKQYYDFYFQNNEQIFPKNKSDILKANFTEMTTGDWVITEWKHPYLFLQIRENKTVDPNVHAISPGFAIRDFMLTSERIRESSQLNEIYHKSYAKHYEHIYEKFINLSAHNFNYEYEIYDHDQGKTFLLDEGATKLFSYLQIMKEDLQEDLYDVLMANINSTIDHFYTNSFSKFSYQSEKVNQLYTQNPVGNHLEVKSYLIEHYNSFLRNVSFTFVTYPANKPLGFYDIKVKLDPQTQCAGNFSQRLRGLGISPALIRQLQTSGLLLHRLNVRESSNKSYCANCSGDKHIIFDLDIDLFQTNRTVWQAIRKIYIGDSPILASSAQQAETSVGDCFTNFAKLFAVEQLKEGEKPISPRFVTGAEEIKMNVVVIGEDNYANVEGSLEIEVTSISVNYAQDNLRGAAIKQFKNIDHYKIDFYRIKDLENLTVANRIKSYLHHTIKVTWHQGNRGQKDVVYYNIPHFTTLANINIVLSGSSVHLLDADYDFKKQLVWNIDEEILKKLSYLG